MGYSKKRGLISLLLCLALLMSYVPAVSFAAEESVSIEAGSVHEGDSKIEITINLSEPMSGGFMRIIQLDENGSYESDKFFTYTQLATIGYSDIKQGKNEYDLTTSPEKGKKVMAVLNLKPRKMAGMMSEGMILSAMDSKGDLALMTVEHDVESGAEVG